VDCGQPLHRKIKFTSSSIVDRPNNLANIDEFTSLCLNNNLFVAIGSKYCPLVPGKSKEDSVLNTILLFDYEERIKSINSIEIKANSRFCNLFDADTQFDLAGTPIMFSVAGCGVDGLYMIELNRLNFNVVKPLHNGWITSLFVDSKTKRVYTTSNDGILSIIDIDPVTRENRTDPQATVNGGISNPNTGNVNNSQGAAGQKTGNNQNTTGSTGQQTKPANPVAPQQTGQTSKPANPATPQPAQNQSGQPVKPANPTPQQPAQTQPGQLGKPANPATPQPAQNQSGQAVKPANPAPQQPAQTQPGQLGKPGNPPPQQPSKPGNAVPQQPTGKPAQ
jgi:hypothetical protein